MVSSGIGKLLVFWGEATSASAWGSLDATVRSLGRRCNDGVLFSEVDGFQMICCRRDLANMDLLTEEKPLRHNDFFFNNWQYRCVALLTHFRDSIHISAYGHVLDSDLLVSQRFVDQSVAEPCFNGDPDHLIQRTPFRDQGLLGMKFEHLPIQNGQRARIGWLICQDTVFHLEEDLPRSISHVLSFL